MWTLTRGGRTEKAVGKLDLEWEISQVVYSQNRSGLARDSVTALPNKPPTISVDGPAKLTAAVGEPLTLAVNASDDGVPKPPKPNPARGAGRPGQAAPPPLVTVRQSARCSSRSFSRAARGWRSRGRSGGVRGGSRSRRRGWSSRTARHRRSVTFSEPGTYTIRAYADDGVVFEPTDITVTVSGSRILGFGQPYFFATGASFVTLMARE